MSMMLDLRPLVRFSCKAILKNPKAVSQQCWLSFSKVPSLLSLCLAGGDEHETGASELDYSSPFCKVTSLESLLNP